MTYPPDDREFVPPEWMQLPNDVQLPSSLRMHNLIEKTALFISKHGSQMEILVKAKQAKNPQFDFLLFDSPLNKYYKYLVTTMKSGDYMSSLERQIDSEGSDDEEDHYLHPSLLGSAAKVNKSPEKLFLPQLPRVPDENSSYSQLVKSLKDKIIREPEKKPEDEQSTHSVGNNDNGNSSNNATTLSYQLPASESSNRKNDSISILPSPPSEVQLYIDKLAEYVARKGEDFEKTIRKRNEARFEFLNPGNIYHCHYIKRKLHFLDQKRQAQADIMLKTATAESLKGPVSFSLSTRENKKTVIVNDDGSPDQLDKRKDSDSDLEEQICSESNQSSVSKEKQEERRRKAVIFLSLLKKKQSEASEIRTNKEDETTDNSFNKNGNNNNSEQQNTDSPSRGSNISLSPTIEVVTSHVSLSKNLVDPSDESSSDSEYSSSKHRANSESSKPSSSSLLPFKSSDKSKQDKSSSSSPSSSTCSKHSSHHKLHHHHHHHRHHHHHHPPHPHHHRHHGHHHLPHPPTPPHHRHHHGHKHHRHHRPHHHGRRRRSHSRSHSRSSSRSRSRSPSRSPHRKSRRRRYS